MRFAQKNKLTQKTRPRLWKKAIFFGLFFILLFSAFLPANPASAKDVFCRCFDALSGERFLFTISGDAPTQSEKDQCAKLCTDKKYTGSEIAFKTNTDNIMGGFLDPKAYSDPPSEGYIVGAIHDAIDWLLIIILRVLGWIFDVAMVLFGWVANAENLNRVISNEGVRFGWTAVRDLLNISFILILLFTAFAIVFQVDKYNKKTTILTLVIMALLINFSFPITRAIIDASNILMYTIIKNISGGTNALGTLTGHTGIQTIISSAEGATTTSLIASIVFVFILMITMLAISLMLVIRIVVLAILIIFSPIAFVPLPGNNYGADWWKKLFSYCFFGPIMMFMILIATQIMSYMGKHSLDMKKLADSRTISPEIVGDMAYFSIPIIILWIGMGMAQKMGIEGASAVMGRAQKMSKWAGKKFSMAGAAQRTYKSYQSRRQEAQKSSLSNKLGAWAGSKQDQIRSYVPLPGKKDAGVRYQGDQAKRIKEENERHGMSDMATSELRELYNKTGNKFVKAAAIKALTEKGSAANVDAQGNPDHEADLRELGGSFGETSQVFRQINAKIRAFDPTAAFAHLDQPTREKRYDEFIKSSEFDLKKIKGHSLADTSFVEALFENNAISAKDVAELSKDTSKRNALNTSIGSLVANRTTANSPMDQNIQMANFSLTGNVSNAAFAQHIFGNMDKDSARNMNAGTVATYANEIAQNVNAGEYKNIIQNMKDNPARKALNDFIGLGAFAGGSNGANVQRIIHADSFLNNL